MLLHNKLIGVVDAVELVHSVKYYDDNTHSTELVTAFFIANLGCDKEVILKLFEKILNYTKCDYLILDQAKLYPNQHEIQKLAEKCNIGKVPIIGNCFSHIIGLITRDFMQNKLTWNGNQSLIPCDLNFDAFAQTAVKLKSGLKRDWTFRIIATFEAIKNFQLDLKFGAWVDLCRGTAIPLLAKSLKRSNAADEGLEEMECIHFKSCLKACAEGSNYERIWSWHA